MDRIRYINETEFEITPQVLYDTAFMSLPEFGKYYSLLLQIELTQPVKDIFEDLFEDLKLYIIKHGVDISLRKSDRQKLITSRELTEPKKEIKRGRGRPKG